MNTKRRFFGAAWTPLFRRFSDERSRDVQDTAHLHKKVHAAWQVSTWSKPNMLDAFTQFILDRTAEHTPLPQNPELVDAVRNTVHSMLAYEKTIFTSPGDPRIASMTLKEQVELRAFLRAQRHFLDHEEKVLDLMTGTLLAIFVPIVSVMPKEDNTTTLTVPLCDFVPNLPQTLELVMQLVADEEVVDANLFGFVRDRLYQNICAQSGIAPYQETTKQLTLPTKADLSNKGLLDAYLAATPLHPLFCARVPFVVPRQAYAQHAAVFAPTGHGKTQTLQSTIMGFLKEPDPPAMFIMDSMGSMLKKIERLRIFNTTLKDRLVIIDPHDDPPPALNFFKLRGGSPAQQMELFFYLFRAIDQSLTRRQATTLTYLVQLMQKIDGTLDTLRQVCEDKQPRHLEAIASLEPIARDFFTNKFYTTRDHLISQTKDQIVDRLYSLGTNPVFHRMFSAKENKFNALQCIEQKKIVLINTDRIFLGDDTSAIVGRFILAQCLAAALARAPIEQDKRHLALLVVDEAKQYFDEQAEKILSDARQFGLGLIFATQYVDQLPEGVRKAMYGNTSIKFIGPVAYSDRVSLAREMNTTPEFIADMHSFDRSHTEFAVHVRTNNLTPRAIKITIPMGTLEREPLMDDAAHSLMRAKNRMTVGATDTAAQSDPTGASPQASVTPRPASQPSTSKEWDSDHRENG